MQNKIELLLSKRHSTKLLKDELVQDLKAYITQCELIFLEWLTIEEYDSKNQAKKILSTLDSKYLILDILTKTVLNATTPLPLTSLAAMVSTPLTTIETIKYIGELIYLFQPVEAYKLIRTSTGTVLVKSWIEPSEDLLQRLKLVCYLPPMITKPRELIDNRSSGYNTIINDSLILGDKENYHDENICLDVLNTLNHNEYELDIDFLSTFKKQWFREELSDEEISLLELEDQEDYASQRKTWEEYQEQFNTFKNFLCNKTIYFTHKVDKRGRIYSQGYHYNPQGSSFEKACLNLKHKEIVTGDL